MTPETFTKIITWLYVSHEAHPSAEQWRIAFAEYLQSLVEGQEEVDRGPKMTMDWEKASRTEESLTDTPLWGCLMRFIGLPEEERTIKGKVRSGQEIFIAIPDLEQFSSMLGTMQEPTFFEINEKGQLVMMDGCKEAYGLGEDFETAQRRQTRKSYRKKGEVIMEKGLPTWDEYQRMNTGQFERETSTWTGTMGGSRARQACWQASAGHVDSFVDVCSNRLDTLGSRGVLRVNLDFES